MLPRLRWSQTVQLFVSYYIRVQCGYTNGYICEKQSIYYVSYYVKLYNIISLTQSYSGVAPSCIDSTQGDVQVCVPGEGLWREVSCYYKQVKYNLSMLYSYLCCLAWVDQKHRQVLYQRYICATQVLYQLPIKISGENRQMKQLGIFAAVTIE